MNIKIVLKYSPGPAGEVVRNKYLRPTESETLGFNKPSRSF